MHLKALPIALSNGPQEKQKPRHTAILPKGHSLVIPFQSIGFINFHTLLLQSIFITTPLFKVQILAIKLMHIKIDCN